MWISTKDLLPEKGSMVWAAILHRFLNASWSWSVFTCCYGTNGNWHENDGHPIVTPDYWQLLPVPENPPFPNEYTPDNGSQL